MKQSKITRILEIVFLVPLILMSVAIFAGAVLITNKVPYYSAIVGLSTTLSLYFMIDNAANYKAHRIIRIIGSIALFAFLIYAVTIGWSAFGSF